jgi:monoamine oxidase
MSALNTYLLRLNTLDYLLSLPIEKQLDVAILGAGISGLAAAKTLLPFTSNLKVYEARDRIGGRINTVN